jgi:general stress protein 26
MVARQIRRQHFAVLATSDTAGSPASAGVTYGLAPSGTVVYVMTRRHLQKARNIAANSDVSLVIPVPRRVLWSLPPATIQLRGQAQIVNWTHAEARATFSGFWLGRQILDSYHKLHQQGENRICFLRIDVDPVIRTYMVGRSLWQARTRMESAGATVIGPGTNGSR